MKIRRATGGVSAVGKPGTAKYSQPIPEAGICGSPRFAAHARIWPFRESPGFPPERLSTDRRSDLRNEAIFPLNPHKRKPLARSGAKPPTDRKSTRLNSSHLG